MTDFITIFVQFAAYALFGWLMYKTGYMAARTDMIIKVFMPNNPEAGHVYYRIRANQLIRMWNSFAPDKPMEIGEDPQSDEMIELLMAEKTLMKYIKKLPVQ